MDMTDEPEVLWEWADNTPLAEKAEAAIAVYGAQDFLVECVGNWDDDIHEAEVVGFVRQALANSRWDRPDPQIVFDLKVKDGRAGYTVNGVIHLVSDAPDRLGRMLILHELAHHIAPRAGHGPVFCRIFVDLVEDSLGSNVTDHLVERLEAHGAVIASAHQ